MRGKSVGRPNEVLTGKSKEVAITKDVVIMNINPGGLDRLPGFQSTHFYNMPKVTPLNYELLAQKKWREFLLTLPEDRTQFDLSFDSLDLMKSFKSTAYEINSDGVGDKVFSLSMDKINLKCTVTILPRP